MNNLNLLLPTGFSIQIEKIPELLFKCIEIDIPNIISNFAVINSPMIDYSIPGEKLEFGTLQITFIVDEDMNNFMELSKWYLNMANPETLYGNDSYRTLYHSMSNFSSNFSDGLLTVLSSNNNPNIQIQLLNLFPISVSGISFATNVDGIQYKVCTSEFKLSHIKFIENNA